MKKTHPRSKRRVLRAKSERRFESPRKAQLTVRGVPGPTEEALRRRALEEGRSLNDVAVEALTRGAGLGDAPLYDDLDQLAGTWEEDPEFDAALEEQHRVDPELWR